MGLIGLIGLKGFRVSGLGLRAVKEARFRAFAPLRM